MRSDDGGLVLTSSKVRAAGGDERDFASLRSLSRDLKSDPAKGDVRVSLCSTSSTDLLTGLLEAALFQRGLDVDLHVADYGLVHAELLDASSPTRRFAPRIAVVLFGPRDVPTWPDDDATTDDADALADGAVDWLLEPCRAIHESCGADVVLSNLHSLPARPLGHLGARMPGDRNNFIRRVDLRLADRAPSWAHIHDVAALAERRGLDHWLDARLWHHAKVPAAPEAQAELATSLAGHIAGILGCAHKCVVVDLDRTLWGGVVGDDGVEGIEIGEGSAEGEAFKAFQLYLKSLARRGVVLAVASKNEDRVARTAFDHPEMVLDLDDFAAFKASWEPKPVALIEIADELGLDLSSMVFIDDNPAEREEVRRALPGVSVPELPDDPSGFPRALDRLYAFETAAVTDEDRERTSRYRARGAGRRLERTAATHEDFLASLGMIGVVDPWDSTSLPRITQLIGKTNQYNLTTARLSAAEVRRRATSDEWVTLALRLRDRFGDHGLVSALWGRVDGETLEIEGWVMSCRVLKRRAEHFLFNRLLDEVRARGVRTILGAFRPTDRNAVCRGHYESLGFAVASAAGEGETAWRLDVAAARVAATPVSGELVA